MVLEPPVQRFGGAGTRHGTRARGAARTVRPGGKRRVREQHRAGAQVRSVHLRRVVRRARGKAAAGNSRDRRRLRRRQGGGPGTGHGAPLRHQPRHRPPGDWAGEDAQEPAGAARTQAHAPQQGAAPGPGDGADLAAAPAPAGSRGRPPDRRPQPGAARRRLRLDAAQGGAGVPAND